MTLTPEQIEMRRKLKLVDDFLAGLKAWEEISGMPLSLSVPTLNLLAAKDRKEGIKALFDEAAEFHKLPLEEMNRRTGYIHIRGEE